MAKKKETFLLKAKIGKPTKKKSEIIKRRKEKSIPNELKKQIHNVEVRWNELKMDNEPPLKNAELQTLNRITQKIIEAIDFNSSLEFIMDEALRVVGLEGGTICLINQDNSLKVVANRETSEETLNDLLTHNIQIGDCLCGNCAKDCKPLILKNRKEVLQYSTREALRGEDIRFHAAFPFIANGKCFGVLCTFTRTNIKPSKRSLKLLGRIVAQTAISIENISLYEKVKANEERLRLSTELAKVAVWEYDWVANIMTRSKNHDQLYGLDWQFKWDLNTFLNAIHPDNREYSNNIIQKSIGAGGGDQYQFDFRVIYPDHSIHWLAVVGEVIKRNAMGEGVLVHGSLTDITDRKKTEDELFEKNSRLLKAEEIAHLGFLDWDLQTNEVFLSDEVYKLYGLTRGSHFTTPELVTKVVHPDDLKYVSEKLMAAINENQDYNVDHRIVRPDGEIIWVQAQGELVKDQSGKPVELLGTILDITLRKNAENSLSKSFQTLNTLYAISKQLGISLNIEDVGAKILESLESLLKWQRGSIWLLNKDKNELQLIAHSKMGLECVKYEKEIERVKNIVSADGKGISRWVALHGKSIRSGNIKMDKRYLEADPNIKSELCVPIILNGNSIGCINVESFEENAFTEDDEKLLTTLSNISTSAIHNAQLFNNLDFELKERIKTEEKIIKLNAELEQRVIERTSQLEKANKELESFVYSVSHDLRAPLRSIMGFSEIISKRNKNKLNEEGLEYFGYILEASKNMANLIEDLLRFSRLAKGIIEKKSIDLNEIMNSVLKNLEQDIIVQNAIIEFPDNLPIIKAESTLLGQILTNLINNAIIYHRKGISPEVKLSVEENEENTIIKINDNGQGIPKEHHEKIFNIFQRLHSNDENSGTGIGLAIVKKAVTALGGRVTLESEVGKGSTFFVILPRQ
ncbi:MAG: PAS domain-containing protein [Ignavibacteriaceae bacterium]